MQPEHWVPRLLQLTEVEFASLKSQIVTSSWGGIRRAAPYALTSTRYRYMSIYCLFVDTLCRHVHDVDMNEQTQAAVKLDQTIPACRDGFGAGRWANLKELGYGG